MNAKENAEDINRVLKELDVTQSDIADNLKDKNGESDPVRQSAVCQVIHRRQTSKRIRDAVYAVVGEHIGRSFEQLWPPQQTE